MWICDECETYNDDKNKICNICGAAQPNREKNSVSISSFPDESTGREKNPRVEYSFNTPIVEKTISESKTTKTDDWYTKTKATVVTPSKISSSTKHRSVTKKAESLYERFILRAILIAVNVGLLIINTINVIGVL